MDALSSISPFSANPDSRRQARPGAEPFSLDHKAAPAEPPAAAAGPARDHLSDLAEACSACEGPATLEARSLVGALAVRQPSILAAARVERDARGAPIQAFPALASAAVQGADPEGWIEPLVFIGASFDAKLARAQASEDLLDMQGPRGGSITALNARLEALSIWTIACAEASHPHSALRALEKAREALPGAIAPLESELARFADPAAMDKPSLPPKARAGAFIEAARQLPGFAELTLPSWIASERGADAASMSEQVAAALDPAEAAALRVALLGQDSEPARAYLAALARLDPAAPAPQAPLPAEAD